MLFHRLILTKFNPSIQLKLIRLIATSPVQIEFKDGLANITVPLPSRGESCVFQLKPFNTTIGDFVDVLQKEDRGIDRASIYLSDGSRLSRNSPVELMFEEPFTLRINETSYNVQPPTLFSSNKPARDILSHVSNSVTKLYHDLRLNQYTMYRERELEKQLAYLRESVHPLNELHHQLANKAIRRLKWIQWSIFAAMSFQTGVLFRLVWIDYSWDIMEPFTYFISYSAVFMAYCYYVLRRHDMKYMNMSDYFYLKILHRLLRKKNFDLALFFSYFYLHLFNYGSKEKETTKPWCWYCNREFDDEKILLQHQKAKHFKCHLCHKKLYTGPGLQIHSIQVHKENIDKVPNALKGRDNIEIEIYGMEGIPEEDLRQHEKRLAGKDKDEPDSTDTTKVSQPPHGMPPMPPLGMMSAAPMMPMGFPGMPFGMTLPMMSVPMMTQMRPPMPMVPSVPGNQTGTMLPPVPNKPLFPSGATDINNDSNSSSHLTTMASAAAAISNLSATTPGSLPGNIGKIEPVTGTARIIHPDDDISLEEFRASLPKYKQMMMPQQLQMPPMPAGLSMANFVRPPMGGMPFLAPPPGFLPMGFNSSRF